MRILKAILLIVMLLPGCSPLVLHPPESLSIGTVAATMNGQEWTNIYKNAYQVVRGSRRANPPCIKSMLNVNFELYSSQGFLRQQLLFSKIPEQTGNFAVVPDLSTNCSDKDSVYCSLFTSIDDGCIAGDAYGVMPDRGNFIQIDRYDKNTGEIKGKFHVTLTRKTQLSISNLPDTLRFTEGSFHTMVIVGRYIR